MEPFGGQSYSGLSRDVLHYLGSGSVALPICLGSLFCLKENFCPSLRFWKLWMKSSLLSCYFTFLSHYFTFLIHTSYIISCLPHFRGSVLPLLSFCPEPEAWELEGPSHYLRCSYHCNLLHGGQQLLEPPVKLGDHSSQCCADHRDQCCCCFPHPLQLLS